jgi:hypothetical protein
MTESSGPDFEVEPPTMTACAAIIALRRKFQERWKNAIGDDTQRKEMLAAIYALSNTPLGDALQAFSSADLAEHKDHLNGLPAGLQKDLVASAIEALNKRQQVNVVLAYSHDGSTAAQVTRYYSDGDPECSQVDLGAIYPDPRSP